MPIIDVYDRCIVDYRIGLSCEAKDAVITSKNALLKRQLTEQKPVLKNPITDHNLSVTFLRRQGLR